MPAWDGTNHSGYQPLDDKVLVLMDEHVEVTSGGIVIPQATAERQSMAGETGLVVALGPAAFQWNDDLTRKWVGKAPEPGDRVYIERYAGQLLQGIDGRTYRLMGQRCVGAIALPPPEVVLDDPEPERAFPLPPLRKERRRRIIADGE
jgi:chaperonin GroES